MFKPDPVQLAIFTTSTLIFADTFYADFVYDDSQAIVNNPDVTGEFDPFYMVKNDFWGTRISHPGSHKSWRPLTTLSFKINHLIGGLNPTGFHVTNVLLHAVASVLFYKLSKRMLISNFGQVLSSLLFSLHPIHCEAVASVVGRADVLMTICILTGILLYDKDKNHLLPCVLLTLAATACKETGVILLPILFVKEFIDGKGKCLRSLNLLSYFLVICSARHAINGFTTPTFSPADNPAAHAENFLTRALTFSYLPIAHLLLLIFPVQLCFDWSMDSVALVETIFDHRFIISITIYAVIIGALWSLSKNYLGNFIEEIRYALLKEERFALSRRKERSSKSRSPTAYQACEKPNRKLSMIRERSPHERCINHSDTLLLSSAIMILPHLLACNLFAYVGFVIAERILYLPSVGFCLIVGIGFEKLGDHLTGSRRKLLQLMVSLLLITYGTRTVYRNEDWTAEETLYKSAVDINPAKAYANLGHVYARTGRTNEAEHAYMKALERRPSMADTHYNLGILYRENGKLSKAEQSYKNALRYRPGFANAWLNLGLVEWELGKDPLNSFKTCCSLDGRRLKIPRHHHTAVTSCAYNAGRYQAAKDNHSEAIEWYRKALALAPHNYENRVSIWNMLGESLAAIGDTVGAETVYKIALEHAPNHVPAHLTMGHLRAKQNRTAEASQWFRRALDIAPNSTLAHLHNGVFKAQMGDLVGARLDYERALSLDPNKIDTITALAAVLRKLGETEEAEQHLHRLTVLSPGASSYANYGAILHLNGRHNEAESYYLKALSLNNDDKITIENLEKLRRILNKKRKIQ